MIDDSDLVFLHNLLKLVLVSDIALLQDSLVVLGNSVMAWKR